MAATENLFEQQESNRRRSFWLVTGFVLCFDFNPNPFASGIEPGTACVAVTEGLLAALERLDAASEPTQSTTRGAAHLCMVDPSASRLSSREGLVGDVSASHPPIRLGIARLRGMAYQQARAAAPA